VAGNRYRAYSRAFWRSTATQSDQYLRRSTSRTREEEGRGRRRDARRLLQLLAACSDPVEGPSSIQGELLRFLPHRRPLLGFVPVSGARCRLAVGLYQADTSSPDSLDSESPQLGAAPQASRPCGSPPGPSLYLAGDLHVSTCCIYLASLLSGFVRKNTARSSDPPSPSSDPCL
jgi:hypothetical protein